MVLTAEIGKGSRPEPAQLCGLQWWILSETFKRACAWSAGKMPTLLVPLGWFEGSWQQEGVEQDALGSVEGWLGAVARHGVAGSAAV